jgi:hypothetical protein
MTRTYMIVSFATLVSGCNKEGHGEYCVWSIVPPDRPRTCASVEQVTGELEGLRWPGYGVIRTVDDGPVERSPLTDGKGNFGHECCYGVTFDKEPP